MSPPNDQVRHGRGEKAHYSAEIIAGALLLHESRIIADLLLHGVTDEGWRNAIVKRNVLKARTRDRANRVAKLIRGRLETMGPEIWKMVRDGSGTIASHAALAAAVKHSRLLGDFLALVVAEQYRQFARTLPHRLWDDYLNGCRERDADLPEWSEATCKRLRSSVFQTLAQAGYIENTRTLSLQRVHIPNQVLHYLERHGEKYVLGCIQVAS